MTRERKRVIVIAPGCDGTDVGEARSSFEWVRHLADRFELTVLSYRKRNRPSLVDQLPGAEVVEWLDWPVVGRFERFNSIVKPGYLPFYLRARRWFRRELRNGRRIDLIHQLAPLALRYPSPAAGLGVPYIVGPLGGSLSTPRAFKKEMARTPSYMYLRGLDLFRLKWDPLLRRTYREAEMVIGVAPYVRELLASIDIKRFEMFSETGISELPDLLSDRQGGTALRLLYVGRLTRMKGVRDAIRAAHRLPPSIEITFDIVGDGEDRGPCEEEVCRFGLQSAVRFHGRVGRQEVDYFYRNADIFVFPSLREPSGNVVLEAMSFGLPLIVADRGGPGFVVEDSFGIRVPVADPDDYARDLADAIVSLAANRSNLRRMGESARNIIRDKHLWSSKVEALSALYEQILA